MLTRVVAGAALGLCCLLLLPTHGDPSAERLAALDPLPSIHEAAGGSVATRCALPPSDGAASSTADEAPPDVRAFIECLRASGHGTDLADDEAGERSDI